MCGLCGMLGGEAHWTTASARPEIFGQGRTRRAERQHLVALANRLLGPFRLRLDDWQGQSFLLTSATGRSEVLDSLPAVWEAAARLSGRRIDPLDAGLLAHLGEAGRG